MRKLFCCSFFLVLSMFAVAQIDSLSLPDFAKGPVKRIVYSTEKLGKSNFSLYYGGNPSEGMKIVSDFDHEGRIVRRFDTKEWPQYDTLIYKGNICERWELSEEHPEGVLGAVIRYDSEGKRLSELYFRADTVYNMDSVVYNQWGKPAMEYTSKSFSSPYSLYMKCSYKYDSTGLEIGMRNFEPNRRTPVSGANYIYSPGKVEQVYVNEKGEVTKFKETYFYDKEGRLVKIQNKNSSTRYSDFDAYGNWQKMVSQFHEEDMPMSVSVVFYRKITYYE